MKKISLLICLILVGCANVPDTNVVIQEHRIVIKPSQELLVIPPNNRSIDIDHASQKDVAQWILDTEQRMLKLEEQLKAIAKFYKEAE